jgi:hypothetical protein
MLCRQSQHEDSTFCKICKQMETKGGVSTIQILQKLFLAHSTFSVLRAIP